MDTLTIRSRLKSYSVAFTEQFSFFERLVSLENAAYVVDENVLRLYPEYFAAIGKEKLFSFHAVEEKKNMESVLGLVKMLLQQGMRRNTTLVSIGGGITQDVTGCVASILYRGVPWIFVPTTLLAQVDSCIGSKTSLNFESSKNILGTFYPPSEIHIDTGFLGTLAPKDLWSGIGEMIKLLLFAVKERRDLDIFAREVREAEKNIILLPPLIRRGLMVKKIYIEEDEFDIGRRNMLNYGHTLGHALESTSHYEIPHGLGVIIGMMCANIVAINRNLMDQEVFDFINKKIFLPNLHREEFRLEKKYFESSTLIEKIKKDKKRTTDNFTFILPTRFLEFKKFNDVTAEEFEKSLKHLTNILKI